MTASMWTFLYDQQKVERNLLRIHQGEWQWPSAVRLHHAKNRERDCAKWVEKPFSTWHVRGLCSFEDYTWHRTAASDKRSLLCRSGVHQWDCQPLREIEEGKARHFFLAWKVARHGQLWGWRCQRWHDAIHCTAANLHVLLGDSALCHSKLLSWHAEIYGQGRRWVGGRGLPSNLLFQQTVGRRSLDNFSSRKNIVAF